MFRRHDTDSNPYPEGSMRVHSVIFLSICEPKTFFLPVDLRSNHPSRPRRATMTSQSRTVEYGLIGSHAIDCIPIPSLYLQHATRMSLALPGEIISSCDKYSPCSRQEGIHRNLETLLRCGSARVKALCGRGTCARIKIFRFGANIQKL